MIARGALRFARIMCTFLCLWLVAHPIWSRILATGLQGGEISLLLGRAKAQIKLALAVTVPAACSGPCVRACRLLTVVVEAVVVVVLQIFV